MSSSLQIVSYTDKSFVVIGDTKTHKDSLKNLGGKWNGSLTNKETGEKFMGWIFYSSKKREIQSWIDTGCKPIPTNSISNSILTQRVDSAPQRQEREMQSESKREIVQGSKGETVCQNKMIQLEKSVQMLLQRINVLENEVKTLKNQTVSQSKKQDLADTDPEEFEEVVEQAPKKRLLR